MLKTLRAFSIFILLTSWSMTAFATGLVDQQLIVRIVPQEHSLHSSAIMTLADEHGSWPTEFQLAAQAEIIAVNADGKPTPYQFANGLLQVNLSTRPASLAISYRVVFDDPVPRNHVGIEDPSLGVAATIMPEGTFLSAASGWHPMPIGRLSRFSVEITGPPGLHGVTDGRLVGLESDDNETKLTWQTHRPASRLALAAGNYHLERNNIDGIQLLVFTSAGNATLAPGYLDSCREYLKLYQELFGPYPYAKFAVVENFYPTGYGLPGWTLLGSSVVRLPFIRTTSLPHEIAHTWWGNAIEIDYQSGNWGEGLATYVADYYLKERSSPAEALEYRRKILRDYAALVDTGDDLPLASFRSRTNKRNQAVGYGKSAMVFHMLRQQLGDQVFWAGLRVAAEQGIDKRYAWSDLQRHFEAVSDVDLSTFFAQWVHKDGAPLLQLDNVSAVPVGTGWQVSGTLSQQGTPYDLLVPLRLATVMSQVDQVIHCVDGQTDFSFTSDDRPVSLSVDPESTVFRRLYPEEIPAMVNNLRASRSPVVIVAEGADALLEASRDLLRGLQWHQAPVMSEADFLTRGADDSDLLVLGWPASDILQPGLPTNFSVDAQQFTIDDKLYSKANDVLFMVLDGQGRRGVTGYFLPASPAAALDTARRIPHYGRYSVLTFRNGRNLVKTTWEPVHSPLKIIFEKEAVR